jgi:Xaa-Pro aminopeptidase
MAVESGMGERLKSVPHADLAELERRLANVRTAMAAHALDGLVVSGSEYSGFEGAVTYLSGFQIVHRYAYVVVPAEGDAFDIVPFDVEFDLARAVKSDAELESVKDSVRINRRGFELFADAYAPGRTAADVMAVAEEYFVAEGCGRLTMNMVLTAPGRSGVALPEFKIARKYEVLGDFVLPSLEIAGPGMHWVEVSRALAAPDAELSPDTTAMADAYTEYYEAAKNVMRAGATCHDVHMAVSKGFHERGYHLGHVTGHSIGMTMIEFPKIGEGVETELAENMVLSMHPHAIAENGEDCLYMQDTWLVTASGGIPLAALEMEIVRAGGERA